MLTPLKSFVHEVNLNIEKLVNSLIKRVKLKMDIRQNWQKGDPKGCAGRDEMERGRRDERGDDIERGDGCLFT